MIDDFLDWLDLNKSTLYRETGKLIAVEMLCRSILQNLRVARHLFLNRWHLQEHLIFRERLCMSGYMNKNKNALLFLLRYLLEIHET